MYFFVDDFREKNGFVVVVRAPKDEKGEWKGRHAEKEGHRRERRRNRKAKKKGEKEGSLTCVVLPQPVSPATSTTRLDRTAFNISSRKAAIGRLARACASCGPAVFTAAACAARAAETWSGVMEAAVPFLFLLPLPPLALMSLFLVPFSSSIDRLFFPSFSSSSSSPAKMPLASDSARATSAAVGGCASKWDRRVAADAADSGRSNTPAALDFSFGL